MHIKQYLIIGILSTLCGCNMGQLRPQAPVQQSTTAAETLPAAEVVHEQEAAALPVIADAEQTRELILETTEHDTTDASQLSKHDDIWLRIGNNLTLPRHTDRRSVQTRLEWYVRNQEYLDRIAERATPYLYYIVEELERRNMPMDLALLPIVESAYHPFAYSPSRASGIWQFIPSTGKHYGLKQNWWYDGRRDIVAATNAALDYLQSLQQRFGGDWLLALGAYNSGERNVERAIKRNSKAGKPTDFWSLKLPRETRNYVPSLLAITELVSDPGAYQVNLQPIDNEPYFARVDLDGQIDLSTAANLAELSMDELYTLNPGFNRWATDPDGPHYLLIPVEKEEDFVRKIAELPADERIKWKRHVIAEGETLGQIAQKYHTSIAIIKQTNAIRGNLIRLGHSLLIPTSKQPMKHYTLSVDSRRFRGLKKSGSGDKYIYRVRQGDNLWDIGNQYGVSIKQLCAWNGIHRGGILRPGQKLTLWLSDSGETTIQKTSSTAIEDVSIQTDLAREDSETLNYIVKDGDSLWLISRRFGITVAQIQEWNNLPRNKILQPGQKLILYREKIQVSGV